VFKINQRILKVALAKKGLPAIAVARSLGIHHTTLSRWVRGWYEVPLNYRSKLAEILEVKLNELFPENNGGPEQNDN